MSNKARILAAIQARPGIGVAELADTLGMFKPNARRDALQLRDKGLVTAEEGEAGYNFFPAGGASPVQKNAVDHYRLQGRQPEPPIDVAYKDVTEPAASRALVVSQPYDSRTAEALAAIDKARRQQGRMQGGVSLPVHYATSLNGLYEFDPTGEQTTAALQLAEVEAARRQLAREQQEAARAAAMAARQAKEPPLGLMIARTLTDGLDAFCNLGRQQAEARAETRRSPVQPVERTEPYEDYFAQRRRAEREAEEREAKPVRPSPIELLLAKNRTRTSSISKAEAQPQSSGSVREWLRARFGTPRKPVWR